MKNAIKGISILTTLLSSKFIFWSSIMYVNCTTSIFRVRICWNMDFFVAFLTLVQYWPHHHHTTILSSLLQFSKTLATEGRRLNTTDETLRDAKTWPRLPKNCLFILEMSTIEYFPQILGIITTSSSHHCFTCGQAGSSNSKILSEDNVWEHSLCTSFLVEVNENTQETQREFSDKLSIFYFSSQPQGYELSQLNEEQTHTFRI